MVERGEAVERNRHSHVQTETITEPMQEGADAPFRRRVLAADEAHVPGASLFREPVFGHRSFLPRIDTDAHGCSVICVFIAGPSFPLLS